MSDGVNTDVVKSNVPQKAQKRAGSTVIASGGAKVAKAAKAAPTSAPTSAPKEDVPVKTLPPGVVEQGGMRFAKGVLKKGVPVKAEECREKLPDGTFNNYTLYTATLVDGTIVTYRDQPLPSENDGIMPEIKKNKDGSFDFIGLYNVQIKDTPKDDMYNLLGCQFTHVDAARGKDKDKIDIANLSGHNSSDVRINYNKGDSVTSPMLPFSETLDQKEYNGEILGTYGDIEIETESVGYGRERRTVRKGKSNDFFAAETSSETVVYSHDGKKLKSSYVNAKEQVLPDGYKIKTSPDGKEQWFFAPDGKQISKETFRNRGLK